MMFRLLEAQNVKQLSTDQISMKPILIHQLGSYKAQLKYRLLRRRNVKYYLFAHRKTNTNPRKKGKIIIIIIKNHEYRALLIMKTRERRRVQFATSNFSFLNGFSPARRKKRERGRDKKMK